MRVGKFTNILPVLFTVFKPQRDTTARKLKICIGEGGKSDWLEQCFKYKGPIIDSQPNYTKNG
jgi:hypothetical protein